MQVLITTAFLAAIGAFHLPAVDDKVADLMQTEPAVAAAVLTVNILGSPRSSASSLATSSTLAASATSTA